MKKLVERYRRSSWYPVFNLQNDEGKARTALVLSNIPLAIVNGLTGGAFYSGLLAGHGFNMVDISIVSTIPFITSLFSFFTPYILKPFPKRRVILSVALILYYLINIVGITVLPELAHNETERFWGLIAIVFVSNSIRFLFNGYTPWHAPYYTPEVRNTFQSANTFISNISSSAVMLLTSLIVDASEGPMQLVIISVLRYISFGIAIIYVWLLQIPKEPEYKQSSNTASILDVLRKPMQDKPFRTTIAVTCLYNIIVSFTGGAYTAWLLEEVQVSYLYITVTDGTYWLFLLFTIPFWNRFIKKIGNIRTLTFVMLVEAAVHLMFSFVNHANYLWLMTLIRIIQHWDGLGITLSINNLFYENLPPQDQTEHTTFHNLAQNVASFISMSLGTWMLAGIGDTSISLFGCNMSGLPLMFLVRSALYALFAVLVFVLKNALKRPESNT